MSKISELEPCPSCGIRWSGSDEFYCGQCGEAIQSLSINWAGSEESLPLRFDGERMTHEGEFWLYPRQDGYAEGRLVFKRDRAQGMNLTRIKLDQGDFWSIASKHVRNENEVEVVVKSREKVSSLSADGALGQLPFSIETIAGQANLRLLPPPTFSILPLSPTGLGGTCKWDGSSGIGVEFENPQEGRESSRFHLSPGSSSVRIESVSVKVGDNVLTIDCDGSPLHFILNGAKITVHASGGQYLTPQRPMEVEVSRHGLVEEGAMGSFELELRPDFGLDPVRFDVQLSQARPFSVAFLVGEDRVTSHCVDVLHEGEMAELSFNVKNDGREPLENLSLESSESWLEVHVADANARSVLLPEMLLKLKAVASGQNQSLLRNGGGSSVVSLKAGSRVIGEFSVIIGEIKKSRVARGYLGIDFGTTNTTCAFESSSDPFPRCLPIRGEELGVYSAHFPSAIAFIDLSNSSKPVFETGSRALIEVRSNGGGNHLSRAIKRKLGGAPITISDRRGFAKTVEPKLIVRWILGDVLKAAREAAGTDGPIEFGKITFTFPAAFSEQQISELESALGSAMPGRHDTKLVRAADEATIGAIGWMENWLRGQGINEVDGELTRTLLVYDFGGGTTDISLLEIMVRKSDRGGLEMIPRPLGLAGLTQLGGEDVTEAIVKVLVKAIRKKFDDNGFDAFIPWNRNSQAVAESHGVGIAHSVLAKSRLALMDFCDQLKISGFFEDLGEEESVPLDNQLDDVFGDDLSSTEYTGSARVISLKKRDFDPVRVYWREKGAHVDTPWESKDLGEHEHVAKLVAGDVEISLEEVILEIRPKIEGAIRRAHELAATSVRHGSPNGARAKVTSEDLLEKIDQIILTGQSSALPLVHELFREAFGVAFSDRVVFDQERAKNVVAEGAALLAKRTRKFAQDPINLKFMNSYLHHPIGREISGVRGLGFEPWFWNGEQASETVHRKSDICLGMILDGECTVFENVGYWGFGELQTKGDGAVETESLLTYFATIEIDENLAEQYLDIPGTSEEDSVFVSLLEGPDGKRLLHAYVSPEALSLPGEDLVKIGLRGFLAGNGSSGAVDLLGDSLSGARPALHLCVEMGTD